MTALQETSFRVLPVTLKRKDMKITSYRPNKLSVLGVIRSKLKVRPALNALKISLSISVSLANYMKEISRSKILFIVKNVKLV